MTSRQPASTTRENGNEASVTHPPSPSRRVADPADGGARYGSGGGGGARWPAPPTGEVHSRCDDGATTCHGMAARAVSGIAVVVASQRWRRGTGARRARRTRGDDAERARRRYRSVRDVVSGTAADIKTQTQRWRGRHHPTARRDCRSSAQTHERTHSERKADRRTISRNLPTLRRATADSRAQNTQTREKPHSGRGRTTTAEIPATDAKKTTA